MGMRRELTSTNSAPHSNLETQRPENTNPWYSHVFSHILIGMLSCIARNPIIASFFNQIGRAEALGSGTRVLYRYSRIYTGRDPVLEEGDVFRASVPLRLVGAKVAAASRGPLACGTTNSEQDLVLQLMHQQGSVSNGEVRSALDCTPNQARRLLAALVNDGVATAMGSTRERRYYPTTPR